MKAKHYIRTKELCRRKHSIQNISKFVITDNFAVAYSEQNETKYFLLIYNVNVLRY